MNGEFRYTGYAVHDNVTNLANAVLLIIALERENQAPHWQRNHYRTTIEALTKEIVKYVQLEHDDDKTSNVPF